MYVIDYINSIFKFYIRFYISAVHHLHHIFACLTMCWALRWTACRCIYCCYMSLVAFMINVLIKMYVLL